nr:integrase, catalytic region, zinc finger, CCHC-type, peptidase aspartic, catalytic [Tanacetum cinerariifolium]
MREDEIATWERGNSTWGGRLGALGIEQSLNVTFDESLPEPKSSPSVEDDKIIEPMAQNPVGYPLLEANALELGYPKSLRDARGHPIEQVISKFNARTLRNVHTKWTEIRTWNSSRKRGKWKEKYYSVFTNLEGVDLLKGDRSTNLFTINLHEIASASPICLIARASSTKSWLWHQRLSHLNFDTINDLARNDLVAGLLKFKYHKEHLCPSCEQGKSKRASHPPKPVPNSRQRLHLLHMDLCRPMRIASINGKRYILVTVDDYSRYTWVHFLRSKDEAPAVIITFLKRITVLVDLLKGDRSTNLYTINLHEIDSASPICLMVRASSTKSWLWHHRLSHLNFDTINDLARNDLVAGFPKFKYHKEHLCPSYDHYFVS